MLSRCRLNRAPRYARCISVPAAPHTPHEPSSSKTKDEAESSRTSDEEAWSDILKDFARPKAKALQRRRPAPKSLGPEFFSSRRFGGQSRKYSTRAGSSSSSAAQEPSPPNPDEPESLFSTSQSAWDHVFDNIDNLPPLQTVAPRASSLRPPSKNPQDASTAVHGRRQSMTAREIDAFNNMFNMIFSAVSEKGKPGPGVVLETPPTERQDPLTGAGIGSGPDGAAPMVDLLGKLRRHSKKFRWSAAEDAALERKKAEMELCATDQQLLEWAAREVFDESVRYEEAARQAVVRAESTAAAGVDADAGAGGWGAGTASPLPMQPPAYPHLLAALMAAFRDRFRDPHLALSVFGHARRLSRASCVFGCTAPAYNELLRTRWACFRDLRGVADALAEMRANGVGPDARTRALAEEIRREVGARNIWQEEPSMGTGEVFEMLGKIELLSAKQAPKQQAAAKARSNPDAKSKLKRWTSSSEQWKIRGSLEREDQWRFGDWDLKPRRKQSQRPMPPAEPSRVQELAFD
ncbi:hypothetical protein DFH11DRAFT_1874417 [Phellopilus nigrolimitatus]|nr:hypothetical protein DFH11DRAFT_1874417 [Phellopilus nigrolimitatus]